MSPLYSNYEKEFNTAPVFLWMVYNNYTVPIISVVAYLAFCYYGQKAMANRKAFDLRNPLAAWNLLLSLFSAWGALRTVPHLIYRTMNYTFVSIYTSIENFNLSLLMILQHERKHWRNSKRNGKGNTI